MRSAEEIAAEYFSETLGDQHVIAIRTAQRDAIESAQYETIKGGECSHAEAGCMSEEFCRDCEQCKWANCSHACWFKKTIKALA